MSSRRRKPWWLLPSGRLNPVWWVPISAVLLWADYATGAYITFPLVYAVPVVFAAWYSGALAAVVLAVVAPFAHVAFTAAHPADGASFTSAPAAIRSIFIVFLALWFARLAEHERQMRQELQALRGLLPICSFCKNIKNEDGQWELLEQFISRRSEARFTHGLCPSCQDVHYSDLVERR